VPAAFLLASAFMVLNALYTDPRNTGITLLIILAGVPVYALRTRLIGRAPHA
jgi:APA family basic amino acid/polyamine antiporter